MRQMLMEDGYEIVDFSAAADVYVINTCSVTNVADKKSRQMIRRARKTNPAAVVAACGCYVQTADKKTLTDLDIDLVIGNNKKEELIPQLNRILAQRESARTAAEPAGAVIDVNEGTLPYEDLTISRPTGHTRAFIKVQDGCNQFCTYCIIPYARGRVASRDEESIISEAEYLAGSGFREVVVSGIHICSYGKDRGEGIEALSRVLRRISEIPGIERIRIGSMEPMSITPEFISDLAGIDKLCPHFHLSLQSGSAGVLKRMNRDYGPGEYLERVRMMREAFPSMSLTTDIICGFPGETDEEFSETLEFTELAGFSKIHVFPYSLREGTVAAKMEQVSPEVKKSRSEILIKMSSEYEASFAASFAGKKTSVLVESYRDGCMEGYSPEYVRTRIPADMKVFEEVKGSIVDVAAVSSSGAFLEARLT